MHWGVIRNSFKLLIEIVLYILKKNLTANRTFAFYTYLFQIHHFETICQSKPWNFDISDFNEIKVIDNIIISTGTNPLIKYFKVLMKNRHNIAGKLIKYMSVVRNISDIWLMTNTELLETR